jgi:hypothetical protein
MPSFKPKNTKSINVNQKSIVTLDGRHNQKTSEFYNDITITLPKLKKLKEEYKQKLKDPKIIFEKKLELKDELKKIRKQISEIGNKKKDYFLENSNLIFDYFENKKNIVNGNNKTKILDKYFKTDNTNEDLGNKEISTVEKYLTNIDEQFLNVKNFVIQTDICKKCNLGELIPIEHEGILVCNKCYCSIPYLVENEKPSYKEPPKEVCFYAYKRINHFREILAQFQAKETTQIPQKVLDDIKNQVKKERMELSQISNKKAKDILKKLGHNKYYEHIPFIKDKLGIKPPIMSQELEETLCNLFMDIQAPYAKYCPNDRVNFLNYYYTVYKLCELLNQIQFLPFFPMLKDRAKRIEQDEIWKLICKELDWEFIPTI